MKYNKLGNSGLSVSNLILGTMSFGTETPEEEAFAILDAFLEAGGNMIGATPSQVALSWVANRPSVSSTVIGARTIEQLNDNLGAADVVLDADALSRLDAVSAPTPDEYPYGRFGSLQRDRYVDSSDQALREL
jgi:aryl-alcohol dehydrogenase-like predicted oxidoreductase